MCPHLSQTHALHGRRGHTLKTVTYTLCFKSLFILYSPVWSMLKVFIYFCNVGLYFGNAKTKQPQQSTHPKWLQTWDLFWWWIFSVYKQPKSLWLLTLSSVHTVKLTASCSTFTHRSLQSQPISSQLRYCEMWDICWLTADTQLILNTADTMLHHPSVCCHLQFLFVYTECKVILLRIYLPNVWTVTNYRNFH